MPRAPTPPENPFWRELELDWRGCPMAISESCFCIMARFTCRERGEESTDEEMFAVWAWKCYVRTCDAFVKHETMWHETRYIWFYRCDIKAADGVFPLLLLRRFSLNKEDKQTGYWFTLAHSNLPLSFSPFKAKCVENVNIKDRPYWLWWSSVFYALCTLMWILCKPNFFLSVWTKQRFLQTSSKVQICIYLLCTKCCVWVIMQSQLTLCAPNENNTSWDSV